MKKILIFFLCLLFFSPSIVHGEEMDLSIASEAAVLFDSQSGAVLYEKNSKKQMYPASLTKIATAIYAIEKGNLDAKVTVSQNAIEVEGTRVYLNEGEILSLRKLVQGMLINSGNDAAIAVAEHLDGSVERFSEQINKYLKNEIGVENTHFVNPHGLFNKKHYTTAADLAKITNYAMKNPIFREIFATTKLPWEGESWDTTLITHHLFLKGELPYEGRITGGKTGYVNESRHTLATTAEQEGMQLTAISLKANHKKAGYDDTEKLLNYGFDNFRTTIIPKGSEFEKGDKKFVLKSDALVSEDLSGSSVKVNNEGILQIKNNTKDTIQTIHLESIPEKSALAEKKQRDEHGQGLVNMNAIILVMGFAVVAIYFALKKRAVNRRYE